MEKSFKTEEKIIATQMGLRCQRINHFSSSHLKKEERCCHRIKIINSNLTCKVSVLKARLKAIIAVITVMVVDQVLTAISRYLKVFF